MRTATCVPTARGIHVIEASASVEEARRMMERLGVAWLGVCREGVLVGTIDEEQLRPPADAAGPHVGALAESDSGRVRWID